MIELVERPLADPDVALRIDVGAEVEEDVLVVMRIDLLVHDDDALGQAEHAQAPDGACHLARLVGEVFVNRDDDAVVEGAGDR